MAFSGLLYNSNFALTRVQRVLDEYVVYANPDLRCRPRVVCGGQNTGLFANVSSCLFFAFFCSVNVWIESSLVDV
jgi:hypothetical protein